MGKELLIKAKKRHSLGPMHIIRVIKHNNLQLQENHAGGLLGKPC